MNPIQQQGFTEKVIYKIDREGLYQSRMQYWDKEDPHYPNELCRPGLGSRPKDLNGEDPGFDVTTRTDQSRQLFPEADKVRMHDGFAVTKDELKNLKCRMNPTCDSKRKGFRQRQADLCDICRKKMVHCQSGNARSRRTEKRLMQRAESAKAHSAEMRETPQCSTQEPRQAYSRPDERIIKCQPRTAWRRPCLKDTKLLLIGDSQISRLEKLLNPDAVQCSFPGCDILDLCCLIDFGSMKFSNFGNDARRNYIAANWSQYSNNLGQW